MKMVYEYLIGVIILGFFWILLYFKNKNLRREMIFGGILYSSVIIPLVLLTKFLSNFIKISWIWIPDYYNPKELFDLGLKIGGGIEDILFIFFAGGIITIFYEALYKREPTKSHIKGHLLSIIGFIISYLIIAVSFNFDIIYNLVISSLVGFIIIIIQRKDLIKHSLKGAVAFTIFYFLFMVFYSVLFPNSVNTYWTLKNISGILVFNVPIEEFLYSISFGLMWAPMYEYVKGIR